MFYLYYASSLRISQIQGWGGGSVGRVHCCAGKPRDTSSDPWVGRVHCCAGKPWDTSSDPWVGRVHCCADSTGTQAQTIGICRKPSTGRAQDWPNILTKIVSSEVYEKV